MKKIDLRTVVITALFAMLLTAAVRKVSPMVPGLRSLPL